MSDEELKELLQVPDLGVILYQLKNSDHKHNTELLEIFIQHLAERGLIINMPDPIRWMQLQYQFIRLLRSLEE